MGGFESFVQGSLLHQTSATSALIPADNELLRTMDGYSVLDLSAGIGRDNYSLTFFVNNATDERASIYHYAECAVYSPSKVPLCGPQPYFVTNKPRTFGIRFSQSFD
jgi:outer membrane receptor protein involved in Fe transport